MNLPQAADALRVPGGTDAASRRAVRFDPEQRRANSQHVRFHPHGNDDCAGDVIFPPKEKDHHEGDRRTHARARAGLEEDE